MDQPKLERLLRLMKMLTANNSLTVDEIATNWVFRPALFIAISTPFGMPGLSLKTE
ncbi:MAG: hypothetical protein PWR15_728 [Bacteroidota bacterium]|jgi:hypothetical protein|nr:hypothetical protein [Bacteroidota bacterium]